MATTSPVNTHGTDSRKFDRGTYHDIYPGILLGEGILPGVCPLLVRPLSSQWNVYRIDSS